MQSSHTPRGSDILSLKVSKKIQSPLLRWESSPLSLFTDEISFFHFEKEAERSDFQGFEVLKFFTPAWTIFKKIIEILNERKLESNFDAWSRCLSANGSNIQGLSHAGDEVSIRFRQLWLESSLETFSASDWPQDFRLTCQVELRD